MSLVFLGDWLVDVLIVPAEEEDRTVQINQDETKIELKKKTEPSGLKAKPDYSEAGQFEGRPTISYLYRLRTGESSADKKQMKEKNKRKAAHLILSRKSVMASSASTPL